MKTVSFTSGSGSVDIEVSGEEAVTLMQPTTIYTDDSTVSFLIDNTSYSFKVTDSITIDGVAFSGTLTQLSDALEAVFPTSSGSGGGAVLESYQNSVMSAPVQAYVYRDADDNIVRVYEPLRNNDVSRNQYVYADSIDAFPFDNSDWFNNTFEDVMLYQIGSDAIINQSNLKHLKIDGGNKTGTAIRDHNHTGLYDTTGEITIEGDNASIDQCVSYGQILRMGDSCHLLRCVMGWGSKIKLYGKQSVDISNLTMDDESTIEILKNSVVVGVSIKMASQSQIKIAGSVYDIELGVSSYIDATSNYKNCIAINQASKTFTIEGDVVSEVKSIIIHVGPLDVVDIYTVVSATLNGSGNTEIVVDENIKSATGATVNLVTVFNRVEYSKFMASAGIMPSTDMVTVSGMDMDALGYMTISANISNKKIINIAGTSYELGESSGNATLTAVS